MSAPEPMAHHVLTPWTLGEDYAAEHTGDRYALRWTSAQLTDSDTLRVLVNADLLDPRVPEDWLANLLVLIEQTPRLTWLLWTRQPEAWRERIDQAYETYGEAEHQAAAAFTAEWSDYENPPANVWLGVRASTQAECDARIPELLAIPAALRWLWLDPLAGEVDLTDYLAQSIPVAYPGLDAPDGAVVNGMRRGVHTWERAEHLRWVVAQGGESPLHPAWVRSLRDQCDEAGVPFRFEGWGEWAPANGGPGGDLYGLQGDGGFFDYCDRWNALGQNPFRQSMCRVGAEASGRLLDGRTHDDVPESREVPRGCQ